MHIFGPVLSRRFGTSLGVDLSSGIKQCNFDCLYCELAPSTTTNNQKYVTPIADIIGELKTALKNHNDIDIITITANGEPTIYPYLDELIEEINAIKGDIKTLILSNGTNLDNPKIFNTLLKFDQVKLSLDAITPEIFKKVDRPHDDINIEAIIKSIIEFSKIFSGELFIEILFVKDLNDSDSEIKKLNDTLMLIRCDRIDIGTIDRPPAYNVSSISYERLLEISKSFDSDLPIHITTRAPRESLKSSYSDNEIIATLEKRPLTTEDIRSLFDDSSIKRLEDLVKNGKIAIKRVSNIDFYIPAQNLLRKKIKEL